VAAAEEALIRYQIRADWHGVAAQLGNLATWSAQAGDITRARGQLAEAAQLFGRLNDPAGNAEVHLTLAEFAINEGDVPVAEAEIERALTLAADLEEPWMAAYGAAFRAEAKLLSGDANGARRDARAAWVRAESLGYRPALIRSALVQAVAEIRLGRRFDAIKQARAGLTRCADTEARQIVSLALTVAVARADHPAGRELTDATVRLARVPGCEPYAVAFLIGSAGAGASDGSRADAAALRSLAVAACG
jgi:tetratricopeptide (TPR) repeat protein